jgi:hypothetical protein
MYDVRCGKNWDPGQAVCAEVYGEDWMNNPEFIAMDQKDATVPPPKEFIAACMKMANGVKPSWAIITD